MTFKPILAGALFLIAISGSLDAQTPPANVPPASPNNIVDTPLPNKVLGQESLSGRYGANAEVTSIVQDIPVFRSPYAGANSLRAHGETEVSHSYTLYLWAHPNPRLEFYVNPEIALGNGVSDGDGLAGYSNGDLIGQPMFRPDPYLARAFVRWRIPLKSSGGANAQDQAVKPANDIIGGRLPASRLVIVVGKIAISDHIDTNAYANNARTQFFNTAFVNNLAYDKAGDPRGYTHGVVISLVRPHFAVRLGTVALPTVAGGPHVSYNLRSQHSEQLEIELHPKLLTEPNAQAMVLRLLAYRNEGTMGRYRDALNTTPGTTPDVTTVRKRGAAKYGFGLNFEQGLSDGRATGIFGRFGWNDGATETVSSAEADRLMSLGGQISGAHWKRGNDILGIALAQSDLSSAHKRYLAAGGLGLTLGDGGLTYGSERVAEVYYSYQLTANASLSPDYQLVHNPGFNRDRSPASLVSLRLHLKF